jgi:hypothetical protein
MEETLNFFCDLCELKKIKDPSLKLFIIKKLKLSPPPTNDKELNEFYNQMINKLFWYYFRSNNNE